MNKTLFKKLRHYHKRFWQITVAILTTAGILAGIIMIAGHYFAPKLIRYQPEMLQTLSETLNRPVTVEHFSSVWEGFGPMIQLQDIKVWDLNKENTIVTIQDAELKLSLLDLIRKQKAVLSAITLNQVQASVEQNADGDVQVVGFDNQESATPSDPYTLLNEITDQGKILVTNSHLNLKLASGDMVELQNVTARAGRKLGKGYVDLSGDLEDTEPRGHFDVSLITDPSTLDKKIWQGDLTVSLRKVELMYWLRLWPTLPTSSVTLKSGQGDIEIALVWETNELTRVETTLALQSLEVDVTSAAQPEATTPDQNNAVATSIKTLSLTSVSGKGHARLTNKGWSIAGNTFIKPVSGGTLSANGSMLLTDDIANSEVDLYAHADDIPGVPTLAEILPEVEGKLPDKLVNWLNTAIVAGTVEQAEIIVQGPLSAFPFENGEGRFEVNADILGAELKFHPKWEPVFIDKGQLHFRADEFYALVNEGRMGGGQIQEASIVIPEIKMDGTEINVTGIAHGTAKNAVAYVKKSPLWDHLKTRLEPMQVDGPIQIDIDVDFPLDEPGGEKIVGAITFENDSLIMSDWGLNFTELTGKMTFDNKGVYSNNLAGKLYQQPMRAQFATQFLENGNSFLKLAMQGEVQMPSLKQYYPNAFWNDWKGGTTYTAEVALYGNNDPTMSYVRIKSDLKGLEVNLPAPFNKSAQTIEPFIIDAEFNNTQQHLKFQYDDVVRGEIYTQKQANKAEINRGVIEINPLNSSTPIQMPNQGVQVIGQLPVLDIDSWASRISKTTGNKSNSYSLPTMTGKLKIDSVIVMKENLDIQMINFQRLSREWKVSFSGQDAQGQLLIPHELSQNPIDLSLDYLNWKTAENKTVGNPPPDNMPNFNVFIKKLTLDEKNIGQVNMSIKMGNKSMIVNGLKVINPDYTLVGASYWDWATLPGISELKGTVVTNNLGGMLKEWGISSGVQGGKGTSKIDLRWHGGPAAWSVDDLKGEVIINWANGRLVDVKPGVGRILSLFSVDAKSIAQRLTLNFSDLYKKGFTFEKITADLILNNGTINTKNGEVDSTSGVIIFNGNAYTITKTLDINLEVNPAISNSSTAVAAGVAIVNPIAGAAIWAANKALSPATDKLISMHYHVTGPFDDPVITPVSSKNAKTNAQKNGSAKK